MDQVSGGRFSGPALRSTFVPGLFNMLPVTPLTLVL